MPPVQVIAHRGASAYAPENTIPSFDLGLQMGADAIETDVRATRDGVLVLSHDARVDRTSNGRGEVASLAFADIGALDFGGRFEARFAGTRIVTVQAFLQRYGRRCPLVLEIKGDGVYAPLAALVESAGLMGSVVFTSFHLPWLENLRQSAPGASIGYLTRQFDDDMIARVRDLGFTQICPSANSLTTEMVAKAHGVGLVVRAWGIDSDAAQEGALQCGADGMTTNWPDRLVARLVELGWR